MRGLIFIVLSSWLVAGFSQELQFGPGPTPAGQELDRIVAIIDDDIITRSELNDELVRIRNRIRQQNAELPPDNLLEQQVLEKLIIDKLQLRASRQNGIQVDDQSLNAAIDDIARRNNVSLNDLRQQVERQEGISFEEYRDGIRQEMRMMRLRQQVIDSRIQISDQEVENWLTRVRNPQTAQEYRLAHILIALPEGASPEEVSQAQEEVETLLRQLREPGTDFRTVAMSVSDGRQALEGGDLGWRSVNQIPTLFADVVAQLAVGEVSDPIRSPSGFHLIKVLDARGLERQAVNQTRARHILIRDADDSGEDSALLELQRLRERILNGEDFATLARANSEDTGSAVEGGDLGWINPGDTVPRFEDEMRSLAPGEVSAPFETRFGWHIVQVLERRLQEGNNDGARNAAREALFRRKSDEEWERWLRRLRDEAYVEVRL